MRPRWQVAVIVFSSPVWFLPSLLYIGWIEAGLDFLKDIPQAMRYIFKGVKP